MAARSTSICQAVRNTVGIAASCASSSGDARARRRHEVRRPARRRIRPARPASARPASSSRDRSCRARRGRPAQRPHDRLGLTSDAIALGQIRHRLRRPGRAPRRRRRRRRPRRAEARPAARAAPAAATDRCGSSRRPMTRTCTSPGPGVGVGTSPTSMTSGPPCRRNSAARIAGEVNTGGAGAAHIAATQAGSEGTPAS